MFALAYTSEALSPFGHSDLMELVQLASAKNKRLEVTGYLIYDSASASFLQLLEGPKEAVEGLMSSIERDPRHRLLSLVPILEEERMAAIRRNSPDAIAERSATTASKSPRPSEIRLFPDWAMKLLNSSDFKRLQLEDELVETLTSMRNLSLGRGTAHKAIMGLSQKLAARCCGEA